MSRDLSAATSVALALTELHPAILYEGEFTGGFVRLWSGLGDLSFNGQTWTGAGDLLGFTLPDETTEIRASGGKVSLSGANTALVSAALSQAQRGLSGKVWIGFFASGLYVDADYWDTLYTEEFRSLIADPYLAFEGKLDVPDFAKSGEQCVITISYEGRLIDLERSRERRITHEDLQIDFDGDLGRQYVAELQDKVVVW
jgi:hypothetical protein